MAIENRVTTANSNLPRFLNPGASAAAISDVIETLVASQLRIAEVLERFAPALHLPPLATPVQKVEMKPPKYEQRRGEKWTAGEDESVVDQFEGGRSIHEIAQAQNRSWIAICARLERLGYVPRHLRLKDLEPPKKQYSLPLDGP